MDIRSIYDHVLKKPVVVMFQEVGLTKQEFKKSCDINLILKRYQKTGMLPIVKNPPLYEDYSAVMDYQESLNTVIAAQEQFDNLPSEIRKRFGNDPYEFLKFCENKENIEEMRKLGLARVPEVAKRVVEPVEPAEPESEKPTS